MRSCFLAAQKRLKVVTSKRREWQRAISDKASEYLVVAGTKVFVWQILGVLGLSGFVEILIRIVGGNGNALPFAEILLLAMLGMGVTAILFVSFVEECKNDSFWTYLSTDLRRFLNKESATSSDLSATKDEKKPWDEYFKEKLEEGDVKQFIYAVTPIIVLIGLLLTLSYPFFAWVFSKVLSAIWTPTGGVSQ